MDRDVRLEVGFINQDGSVDTWYRVELDKAINIAITAGIDGIEDPVVKRNTNSNSIRIVKTNYNSYIFSHVEKYDARVEYEPLWKNRFRLYLDDNVYQTGYFKLENTDLHSYNITLFGSLGDILRQLNTKDDNNTALDARIKNLFYDDTDPFEHTIDRNTVVNSFQGTNVETSYYDYGSQSIANESILAYAPTYQGSYPNFNESKAAYINEADFVDITWKSGAVTAPQDANSLNEHQRSVQDPSSSAYFYGEYRSYYQRPVFRFKHILNKVLARIEAMGYGINLSPLFFKSNNPYWQDIWGILPQYPTELNDASGSYSFNSNDAPADPGYDSRNAIGNYTYTIPLTGFQYTGGSITVDIPFKIVKEVTVNFQQAERYMYNKPMTVMAQIIFGYSDGTERAIDLMSTEDTGRYVEINPETTSRQYFFSTLINGRVELKKANEGNAGEYSGGSIWRYQDVLSGIFIPNPDNITSARIAFVVSGNTWWDSDVTNSRVVIEPVADSSIVIAGGKNYVRSGSGLSWGGGGSMNRIFGLETTCSEFLLAYCKMFGLYINVDEQAKTFNILTRPEWYTNERIDITHRIDYNQTVDERICPFTYRYGLLKYKDVDIPHAEIYKKRTGLDYGQFRFDIGTEFTEDERDLLESPFENSIDVVGYDGKFYGRTSNEYQDNKQLMEISEKTEGIIPVFFTGYSTTAGGNSFIVSDDTPYMTNSGEFCWLNLDAQAYNPSQYAYTINRYPLFSKEISRGGEIYSLNFGTPSENYTGTSNEKTTDGIYYRQWKRLIDDRFNKHSRVITVTAFLTDGEIRNILRKFVFIENTPWVVQEIKTSSVSEFCELTLIYVNNVNNYLYYAEGGEDEYYIRIFGNIQETTTNVANPTTGPSEGAVVTIGTENGVLVTTITNADGDYEYIWRVTQMEYEANTLLYIEASKPGYINGGNEIQLPPFQTAVDNEIELDATIQKTYTLDDFYLSQYVWNTGGSPALIEVTVTAPDTSWTLSENSPWIQSNKTGPYQFQVVTTSNITGSTRTAPIHVYWNNLVRVLNVSQSSSSEQTQNVTFRGTVRDGNTGNPIAGAVVYIYNNGNLINTATTDNNGAYSRTNGFLASTWSSVNITYAASAINYLSITDAVTRPTFANAVANGITKNLTMYSNIEDDDYYIDPNDKNVTIAASGGSYDIRVHKPAPSLVNVSLAGAPTGTTYQVLNSSTTMATIRITVPANTGTSSRSFTVTADGGNGVYSDTASVNQLGNQSSTEFNVTPSSLLFPAYVLSPQGYALSPASQVLSVLAGTNDVWTFTETGPATVVRSGSSLIVSMPINYTGSSQAGTITVTRQNPFSQKTIAYSQQANTLDSSLVSNMSGTDQTYLFDRNSMPLSVFSGTGVSYISFQASAGQVNQINKSTISSINFGASYGIETGVPLRLLNNYSSLVNANISGFYGIPTWDTFMFNECPSLTQVTIGAIDVNSISISTPASSFQNVVTDGAIVANNVTLSTAFVNKFPNINGWYATT